MAWGKVDDKLYSSPKWMQVSKGGKALWVSALSWCMAQLTDGAVPKRTCSMLGASTQDARSLVEAGLWTETEDGYQFHDWLDYQPSREQVLSEREAARQRQQKARDRAKASRKRHGVTNGVTHDEVPPPVTGDVTVPPTRPDPTPTREPKGSLAQTSDSSEHDLFEDFWDAYPRKVGKQKARSKFTAACRRAPADHVIAGAHRLASDPNLPEAQFVPHPTTWLERDGWEDEPLPPRNTRPGRPPHQPKTFDQIRHDANLDLWEQVKREEEGNTPWPPKALGA